MPTRAYRSALSVPLCLWGSILLLATQASADLLESHRFLPPTASEARNQVKRVDAIADRVAYWNDDPVGQFVVNVLGEPTEGRSLTLSLRRGDAEVWSRVIEPVEQPKVALLLRVGDLDPGAYTLRAALSGEQAASAEVAFTREDKRKPAIAFPDKGVAIEVQPQDVAPAAAWPICTGVAFPQGTVADLSQFTLLEDGKPVPAQLDLVSTWHPRSFADGSDYQPSVRWAHLKFVARYDGGKPHTYTLRRGEPATPATPIRVEQTDDAITVDTGAIRFSVSRKAFAGISAAWLGDTQVFQMPEEKPAAPDSREPPVVVGPYVQDHRGIVFQSRYDENASVVVEEAGPLRVVIAAEGWYIKPEIRDEKDRRLCRFRTRLIAFAGRPDVRVQHHTIVTFDSDKVRLMDLGWKLPTPAIQGWTVGVDGKPISAALVKNKPAFLHQYRWNKLRVLGAGDAPVEGERSDGYLSVTANGVTATICLRDVWQKYPKELEIEPDGPVVHFWPEHGIRTFDRDEMFSRADLHKLRFFHHGRLLDLRFPSEGYDTLMEFREASRDEPDPEGMRNAAIAGNAQGVAIGADLLIRLHDGSADAAELARLFQLDPHARPDPRWTVATEVEGRMHPVDRERFPKAEQAIDELYPGYMRGVIDATAEYGMFIYTNWHNTWLAEEQYPRIHRVWQNSHYQQVGIPWLLYMRGSTFDMLTWARANGDNYRDVGTIHYVDADAPIAEHSLGGMYHAKGYTPWGSAGAHAKLGTTITWAQGHNHVQGHWVNPDAYLLRYLVEGDLRSLDCMRQWSHSFTQARTWGGASREVNNTLGEALNYYANFHDPDMLRAIHIQSEGMLATPLVKQFAPYHHPVWHMAWFSRLFEQTRDPRIGPALVEYADTYPRWLHANIFAYRVTGDTKYLQQAMAGVHDTIHCIYRHEDDPRSGYCGGWYAYTPWTYRMLPYFMAALVDAGIEGIEEGGQRAPYYLSRATHPQFIESEGPAMELIALDPDDRAFAVTLRSRDRVYDPAYRVIAPSGKVLHERVKGETSRVYQGENELKLEVTSDRERGVYHVDFRNWEGMPFDPPLTDLPVEGVLLHRGKPVRPRGRSLSFLAPVGDWQQVQLTFRAVKRYDIAPVDFLRLTDANGRTILETTVVAGAARSSVTATIDRGSHPTPWRLFTAASFGPELDFDGVDTMVAAPSGEAAAALVQALEQ